jgi:hypothetical protein
MIAAPIGEYTNDIGKKPVLLGKRMLEADITP